MESNKSEKEENKDFVYNNFQVSYENNIIKLKTYGKGPINIALIKYWGKDNEHEIIPLNNSISVTLDMEKFYTETHAELIIDNKSEQELFKNEINLTQNQIRNGSIRVTSHNTFPTAAGCASSASSMSILVKVLSYLFNYKNYEITDLEMSSFARLGSGSACRSIFGGFAEWHAKLIANNIQESYAVQIADENHWKNFNISLLILSDKKKERGSTVAMKLSKETSQFLKILPKRLIDMRTAILEKDFDTLAELTMKDSNNFHAVCRDTFPTINYLNETSEFIIRCVENMNSLSKDFELKNKYLISYSFDAGPNAFIFYLDEVKHLIEYFFNNILFVEDQNFNFDEIKVHNEVKEICEEYLKLSNDIDSNSELTKAFNSNYKNLILTLRNLRKEYNYYVKEMINFKPGKGAYLF